MSFKIVQTLEKGMKVLSTIPVGWENQGTLYWPRKDSNKLQEDPLSVPDKESWPAMQCIVKRSGIKTLKEALMEERRMSHLSDTDEEATDIHLRKKSKRIADQSYDHLLSDIFEEENVEIDDTIEVLRIENLVTESTLQLTNNNNEINNENMAGRCLKLEKRMEKIEERLAGLETISVETHKNSESIKKSINKMEVLLEKFLGVNIPPEDTDTTK